jgi:hypothetical protein
VACLASCLRSHRCLANDQHQNVHVLTTPHLYKYRVGQEIVDFSLLTRVQLRSGSMRLRSPPSGAKVDSAILAPVCQSPPQSRSASPRCLELGNSVSLFSGRQHSTGVERGVLGLACHCRTRRCKFSDFRLSQALANQVVRKGVCGDFILCGLSPPVSADRSLVHRYTFVTK